MKHLLLGSLLIFTVVNQIFSSDLEPTCVAQDCHKKSINDQAFKQGVADALKDVAAATPFCIGAECCEVLARKSLGAPYSMRRFALGGILLGGYSHAMAAYGVYALNTIEAQKDSIKGRFTVCGEEIKIERSEDLEPARSYLRGGTRTFLLTALASGLYCCARFR